MGGLGLDARMIRDADRDMKRRWGILAYLRAILINLKHRPVRAWVTVDDQPTVRRKMKTVMVANMAKMASGLEAMPRAEPQDGLLDVCVVTPEKIGQWLRLLWLAILGRPQDSPDMDVFQGRKVVIRTSVPEPVEFDGESWGYSNEVTIEVLPAAAKIMLPLTSPATQTKAEAVKTDISRMRIAAIAVGFAGIVAGIAMLVRRRRR